MANSIFGLEGEGSHRKNGKVPSRGERMLSCNSYSRAEKCGRSEWFGYGTTEEGNIGPAREAFELVRTVETMSAYLECGRILGMYLSQRATILRRHGVQSMFEEVLCQRGRRCRNVLSLARTLWVKTSLSATKSCERPSPAIPKICGSGQSRTL